jgi:polysaccharide biosynthesis protein PslH
MKLLFVTAYLPSPPRFGGSMRIHGLLSELSRRHSVVVLSYVDPRQRYEPWIEATRAYADEVVTVPNTRIDPPARRKRVLQMRSMASRYSFERLAYFRPAMQQAIDDVCARHDFDVITIATPLMGYFRFPEGMPLVLDEHNIEYDLLRRTYEAQTSIPRRIYSFVDYLQLRREERAQWRKVGAVSVPSERDERVLLSAVPGVRTEVVPNGVDSRHFTPVDTPIVPGELLFFGAVSYYPNTDGLRMFYHDVFPRLRRSVPDVRLTIVGNAPPAEVRAWESDAVHVTGYVDDVRPYLARANVIIVPLRIGGGTRLKILEAMAMGKAVVSTSLGAEGIDVTDGHDILLAGDAKGFAAQVQCLIENPTLALDMGVAARSLVEQRYDWQRAAERMEALHCEVSGRRLPQPDHSPNRVAADLRVHG